MLKLRTVENPYSYLTDSLKKARSEGRGIIVIGGGPPPKFRDDAIKELLEPPLIFIEQEKTPEDIQKVINENLWDLL